MAPSSTSQLATIQSTLDNFKQNMEENAYLELCNKLKELYGVGKNQEENPIGLYRLTVIVPEFTQVEHANFRMLLDPYFVIVQMTKSECKSIKTRINQTGSYNMYQPRHWDKKDKKMLPFPTYHSFYIFNENQRCELCGIDYVDVRTRHEFTITQNDHHCVVAIDKLE